jgi:hypothetical protein
MYLNQNHSFKQVFVSHFFVSFIVSIDSGTNNPSSNSFSRTNQNNFRNDNHTYSNGTNNTFNSRGGGFAGLIILFIKLFIFTDNC